MFNFWKCENQGLTQAYTCTTTHLLESLLIMLMQHFLLQFQASEDQICWNIPDVGQQRHQTIPMYDMMSGVEPKPPQDNDDIPVLPATDLSCCFARELVLTLYIGWDTTRGKWRALLLSFKGFRQQQLFRASLVLTEQVYIHALWTESPFLFRFAPRSQSSLEDLFAFYVGKWIRKYWQFSKCLLWISMSASCTG